MHSETRHLFLLLLLLLVLSPLFTIGAQEATNDSRVSPFYTEKDKKSHEEKLRAEKDATIEALRQAATRTIPIDYSSRAVGEIPLQEGVSSSGARTYQISIPTAAGFKFVPNLSLCYNSQGSDGLAGYGWDIQGVSRISLISKNKYYHNEAKGANVYDTDPVFALDGIPLVTNTQPETMDLFPLITASGYILAAPVFNNSGYVTYFTVLYPNGVSAIYGFAEDLDYNLPSYPVTEMRDNDDNKISFIYHFDSYNGTSRILHVRYGYSTPNMYHGEITFEYVQDTGVTTRYYAGKRTDLYYRVIEIVSKTDNTVICRLPLTYDNKDYVRLLSQVDCISGVDSLRPLQFQYDYYPDSVVNAPGHLSLSDSLSFSGVFSPSDTNLVYKRGKFVYRSNNDGIVVYPYYPSYSCINISPSNYAFDSLYPSDQCILFIPSLKEWNNPNTSITTGPGFQTIEAVDVDGDGIDELVKVNLYNSVFSSSNGLSITVYKCNTNEIPVQIAQFTIPMSGAISSGPYYSPYRREYFWGDFLGNGKTQLLSVAYDQNYNPVRTFAQTCYATLIDITGQTKLCDYPLFTFPEDGPKRLFTCDLDNESQTKLCYATASGLDVYRFAGSSFSKEKTLSSVTSSVFTTKLNPAYITDLNGDGYVDIMTAPQPGLNTYWTRYSYNGSEFSCSFISICYRSSDDSIIFMDINRDGLADLVKISGTTLSSHRNIKGFSFEAGQPSTSAISNSKGILQCNVVDRYGMSAFMKIDGNKVYGFEYSAIAPRMRHITRSIDSFGKVLVNSYQYLPDNSRVWSDPDFIINNEEGFAFKSIPFYLLNAEDGFLDESLNEKYKENAYSYYDGVIHHFGLGFCGFLRTYAYDYRGGFHTTTIDTFDPQKRGVLMSRQVHNFREECM
ncbi:MAG: VCBS repeat-containing protein, partial [Bacteroidales bacterium]|nr:VCBS repeat-containing protein [Bacteroidales bacterium]